MKGKMEKKITQFIVTFFAMCFEFPQQKIKIQNVNSFFSTNKKEGIMIRNPNKKKSKVRRKNFFVQSGMCTVTFNDFFKIQKWNVKDAVNNLFVYFLFENVLSFWKF